MYLEAFLTHQCYDKNLALGFGMSLLVYSWKEKIIYLWGKYFYFHKKRNPFVLTEVCMLIIAEANNIAH